MKTTRQGTLIYSVGPGEGAESLDVVRVASVRVPLKVANLTPLVAGDRTYLLGSSPDAAKLAVFTFTDGAPWLDHLDAQPAVGTGWDVVEPFALGNEPYLACYRTKDGMFNLFRVFPDLTLSKPFEFCRRHEPGVTKDFTTIKCFTACGKPVFLGYDIESGRVAAYFLSVLATSPPNTLRLLMVPVWSHEWAGGWTRFAFFQFGGSNFFLKTNIAKPNVNIDHVQDDVASGTIEIGSHLELTDALELQLVEPLILGHGDPYFVTYKADGAMTVNRFWGDCMGWTTVATLSTKARAKHVVPATAAGKSFLIIA